MFIKVPYFKKPPLDDDTRILPPPHTPDVTLWVALCIRVCLRHCSICPAALCKQLLALRPLLHTTLIRPFYTHFVYVICHT